MEIFKQLSFEFNLKEDYSKNIIDLLDEGNTIPFIARYRKEAHGACDDQVLREFADRLTYLRNLNKEKEKVEKTIKEQEKWTNIPGYDYTQIEEFLDVRIPLVDNIMKEKLK